MLFAIHMIDRPHGAALRAATSDAHREFVGRYLDSMYVGGPLLADDGETAIGSLIVMDFPDRGAAVEFIADEPYNRAGLFESVTIRAFGPVVRPEAKPT
ncbi:MAG: YciI family protein [Acidimicrobiia bacterium]|nr:YciI family protein [Acidimicrobiia bacterium]